MHPRILDVTARIRARSRDTRSTYLDLTRRAAEAYPPRSKLSCANLAHAIAASPASDKLHLRSHAAPNIGIVTAYNDMLSAHQPLEGFPALIKKAARAVGAVAQVAGGVPAMCDGVTQGNPGMELSLFSRDVIAMGTAVALSHNMFDAALLLGVCDKIVPGLLIGALSFGHLPAIFVPAGPMDSGVPNAEKSKIRQLFATGQVGRDRLLEVEMQSYHGAGTCTFYGTANSNQLLLEMMGLHLPGAAFVHPGTELRDALTMEAARRVLAITARGDNYTPISQIVDERVVVNGIVGLRATGGSTNHTLHLVAIAQAAGIQINWDDFDDISAVTPLLARIYPNGPADVNHFHAAGGVAFLIGELLDAGMLHPDVATVAGPGLARYRQEPMLRDGQLAWHDGPSASRDATVLTGISAPFEPDGGLRLIRGNLGRGVMKVSAVKAENRLIEAPAIVFNTQEEVVAAHQAGALQRDFVAVLRFQGPRANGMPELHRLTPVLGALMDQGFRLALLTDGRMSGASGKVPAVIHISPEALGGGPLGLVRTGDMIRLDVEQGRVDALIDEAELHQRSTESLPAVLDPLGTTLGRSLFGNFRAVACSAEQGASVFGG